MQLVKHHSGALLWAETKFYDFKYLLHLHQKGHCSFLRQKYTINNAYPYISTQTL